MFGNLLVKFYLKWIERKGFIHGKNFDLEKGANIDAAFCNLIKVGNNVTLAKDVYILAHDASMKMHIGKTKIGPVEIGNNVFVGAKTVILPNVKIGDNTIIAAGSVVTKNIPNNEVWGGVPANFLMYTSDFIKKHADLNAKFYCSKDKLEQFTKNNKIAYTD